METGFFSWLFRLPLVGRWFLLILDRKRQLRAAADLVAHELEFNAEVADKIALGGRTPATVAHDCRSVNGRGLRPRSRQLARAMPNFGLTW